MGRDRVNPSRDFFKYDKTQKKSICILCNIIMTGDHAGNLERHLRRNHKHEYDIIVKKKLKLNEKGESAVIEFSHIKPFPSTSGFSLQQTLETNKEEYEKSNYLTVCLNKETVLKACLELITVNGCSFEMLEYSGFKKILNPIVAAIGENFAVNSENIKLLIPDTASKIVSHISKLVEKRIISLQVDIATRLNRSILGINAQVIIDGKINSFTLGMTELKDEHTGVYIKSIVQNILQRYNIDLQQIYSITTDNEANMIQFVEALETDVKEEYIATRDHFEENVFGSEDVLPPKLNGIICAAHTLQLVIRDSVKSAELNEFVSECRELVKKLRVPSVTSMLKDNKIKKPELDCPTRWNSTYNMLETLLKCKDIICYLSLAENNVDLYFPESNWDKVKLIVETLQPLTEATLKLQSEQLTLSDFFGIWIECKLKLQNLNNYFSTILVEQLSNQEKKILENESLLGAIFLDPRFQILLNTSQKMQAKLHLKYIWDKLEIIEGKVESYTERKELDNNEIFQDDADDLERFLKSKEMTVQITSHNSNVNISNILNTFEGIKRLERKKSVLQFWEETQSMWPCLYKIASVVLGVPATQSSMEQSFSSLRFILRENRDSLSENMLENILIIKSNYHIFQNL